MFTEPENDSFQILLIIHTDEIYGNKQILFEMCHNLGWFAQCVVYVCGCYRGTWPREEDQHSSRRNDGGTETDV